MMNSIMIGHDFEKQKANMSEQECKSIINISILAFALALMLWIDGYLAFGFISNESSNF